uniref:Lactate dehydrogenase n=1 Tax=Spiroplasma platyhelix PALS-1 TaxID=1276218 RepID=A0A846TPZ2_9MOLU|nr:lactate dehydrogenase [Spiroplasma platyhelix PALS-1]
MKVMNFGVNHVEIQYYEKLNQDFNYDLSFESRLLDTDTVAEAKGFEVVTVSVNCKVTKENLDKLKALGVKYLFTRTVGVNHIDVDYAKQLGFKMARVPFYSANSVSELAVSLSLGLLRNTFYMAENMRKKNFKVDDFMFAKEIRNSVIGVIGTGRIGMEAAKAFKGMGAKVLGYDIYPNDANKAILDYVSLDELLAQSDLITIHSPYIPGENDNMINKDTIAKMKKGAFFVNVARGSLVNYDDLYEAIESQHLRGAAVDSVQNETQIFLKDFAGKPLPIETYEKLHSLYPRVIFTPHIGYYTDLALEDIITTTFENIRDLQSVEKIANSI